MRWVIYTDLSSSILAIESNRESHPILNRIYDILAELLNQEKQVTLCKVSTHIGIKGNDEAVKAANQATNMPGMTTTNYLIQTIRSDRNSE